MNITVAMFDKFNRRLLRCQVEGKYKRGINQSLYHKTTYGTNSSVTINNIIILNSAEVKYLEMPKIEQTPGSWTPGLLIFYLTDI